MVLVDCKTLVARRWGVMLTFGWITSSSEEVRFMNFVCRVFAGVSRFGVHSVVRLSISVGVIILAKLSGRIS